MVMSLIEKIHAGIIGTEDNKVSGLEETKLFGKPVMFFNGLEDKALAEFYWKLDGNAFEDLSAPEFQKLDCVIMGGLGVMLMLETKELSPEYLKSMKVSDEFLSKHPYLPIGFFDIHKLNNGKSVCSGLGIAKDYQDKKLAKHLLYAGLELSGTKELIWAAQLSNFKAHYAWLSLGKLEIVKVSPFHSKPDTVVYKAKIDKPSDVFLPKKKDCCNTMEVNFKDLSDDFKGDFLVNYNHLTEKVFIQPKQGVCYGCCWYAR